MSRRDRVQRPQNQVDTLRDALLRELEYKWIDLEIHRRELGPGGVWSLRSDDLAVRIQLLSLAVGGPLDPGAVGVDVFVEDVYERVHEAAGIPVDTERINEIRARWTWEIYPEHAGRVVPIPGEVLKPEGGPPW